MIYWAEIDDLTGWLVKVVSKKDKNYSLYLVVQEVRLQKLNVDKYWLIGNAYFNERLAIFNAKRPVLNHTIYSEIMIFTLFERYLNRLKNFLGK